MASIQARLDLVPADAVAYFRSQGLEISWDWHEMQRDAHARAFTVAKAASEDVLRTIRQEVDKAIGEGQTLAEFIRTLRPRLQDQGWWGTTDALDADTGEITRVQLGSERRLRMIFQTNVQTAYMAGRYKRLLDNVEDRPYWQYVAVMDSRTRPAHAALNGKVFRWDDPIWKVIFPPNGWGCRCRVRALSTADVERLGLRVETGQDRIVEREVALGRDQIPTTVRGVRYQDELGRDRVFYPDPSWDYNPGEAWARFDAAGFRSALQRETLTEPPLGAITAAQAGRPGLNDQRFPVLDVPGLTSGDSPADAHAQLLAELVPGGNMREVQTPLGPVVLRPELLPALQDLDDAALRMARAVMAALQAPAEIWLGLDDDGYYRRRYFGVFGDRLLRALYVRENRDGSLFWKVFSDSPEDLAEAEALRQGTLLYGVELRSVGSIR